MIGTKKVKVGGKTYTYPRNYQSEYGERTTIQKANRITRRQARQSIIDRYGKAKVQGKDVDHIKGVGKGNGAGNLRVTSIHFNRSRH